ncbi:MAG: SPOR domain-containing protein [Bacteroidales bacterium]|nr:SPOR domain-containing protein [Bacteroidales bacterium]
MRHFIVTLVLIISCVHCMAQNSVRYSVEPAIANIQDDYVRTWRRLGEMNGYRIQIAAVTGTNSKSTAESERYLFLSRYPDIPAYISYMEPYFRIRVGNFASRLDAYFALQEIISLYPNAYIIPDKITYSN